ncbi:hypothetical protein QEG60_004063 [Pluralibacter gergoviae]|uniref:hypothetical protein n=1 Tax=Pluralibacter gergoviae TaxID=61647 RepID=UPI00111AEE84|nr:hypothetical protein [Pluralibacter gergoviae]EKT9641800.1 hypothetical protein [Pluralibacter gergoviae]EKV3545315.1 hypothetical protein [Pluralibacter gergoviae]EKV9898241.1 hypothetical protein [Pluralibacter gergoviae]EKV9933081.1 hypothetical protein [Pluralibacter gergoviae]EKW9974642.1 hypothetical protein [Pluralibacter gergoviae]
MSNRKPKLKVSLCLPQKFTGRVMLYMQNGVVKSEVRLLPEEIIGTPTLFTQMLERAGYQVTPVEKG